MQYYVMKFFSHLWQVGCFLWLLLVSSINKTDHHDIRKMDELWEMFAILLL